MIGLICGRRFDCISLSAVLYILHFAQRSAPLKTNSYAKLYSFERERQWLVRERIAQSDLSEKSSQGILHFTSQQSNWTKVGAKALSYETIIIVVCTNCTHTTTLTCSTTYTIKLNVLPYKLKSKKDLTFLKCEPTTCKANYIQFKSLRSKQTDLTQSRKEISHCARWTKERVKEFQQRNWCTKTKQR